MTDISKFGKGAIPTPAHIKAGHFKLAMAALPPVDWNVPYNIENVHQLVQRDQKTSSSCTAQAACYYAEALDPKHRQFSARYNYSQSAIGPNQGAFIWKAMSIPVSKGLASPQSVPDGDSSEGIMIDPSLNAGAVVEAMAFKYAQLTDDRNIDTLASIIKQYSAFQTGFNGRDDMFSPDGTANPFVIATQWGHSVFVTGYELHNGIKCLKFKNSWTAQWGTNGSGYFPAAFVASGLLFDAYVYASVSDLSKNMTEAEVKNQYLLGFNRLPDAGELAFWLNKPSADFVKQAVVDRKQLLINNS